MTRARPIALSLPHRVRLGIALVILAAFAVLSAVGIGVTLHDWAETNDSLVHWQARLEEQPATPAARAAPSGSETPRARIRDLEDHVGRIPERLIPLILSFVACCTLVVLGYRALRRARS